jgi:hypothetical protein
VFTPHMTAHVLHGHDIGLVCPMYISLKHVSVVVAPRLTCLGAVIVATCTMASGTLMEDASIWFGRWVRITSKNKTSHHATENGKRHEIQQVIGKVLPTKARAKPKPGLCQKTTRLKCREKSISHQSINVGARLLSNNGRSNKFH